MAAGCRMFCEGSALLRSFLRRHGLLSGSKGPTWEQCLPLSDSVTTTLPVGLGHSQQPQAPVCGSFSRASLAISHRVALRSSIHPCFTWNPLRVSSTPAVCRDLSLSCLSASLDTLLALPGPSLVTLDTDSYTALPLGPCLWTWAARNP